MVQYQLKLRLNSSQGKELERWLFHLQSVWNWAIRKIELDGRDKIYYSRRVFQNLLANHSGKMNIPSHILQGMLAAGHDAWVRCWKGIAGKPKLKGQRNKLNSIPFPDPIACPENGHIRLPGLGLMRFHRQWIPEGKIKCGRIIRRASGWHLCLFIDAQPKTIPVIATGVVGIDPGFKNLLVLSTGEVIDHPRELEATALRLGQAQRGQNRRLASRLQERIANRRKDRNHKLSRRLVSENAEIYFSADNHKGIAKQFGKGVASSGHYQLRQMLDYKCRAGGRRYVEVDPRNSTMTCSFCGAISGPTGLVGLSVRQWRCKDCGSLHDRDINAARNTLLAGVGYTHEAVCASA